MYFSNIIYDLQLMDRLSAVLGQPTVHSCFKHLKPNVHLARARFSWSCTRMQPSSEGREVQVQFMVCFFKSNFDIISSYATHKTHVNPQRLV